MIESRVPSDSTPQENVTRLLRSGDTASIAETARLIQEGKVVVFPTDTVYGVGVHAFHAPAIRKLYSIKGRSAEKGIPILLADLPDLAKVANSIPPRAWILMERFWPGPLTIIVPRHPDLPEAISPNGNIAVRIPDHGIARDVIRAAGGAVATTSANLSGQKPAQSGHEALTSLNGRVAAVLDDGPSPGNLASTIVDCTSARPVILRQGPLSAVDLELEDNSG